MWDDHKDNALYRIQSNAYILRIIVYDAALHYNAQNRWTGWPTPILGGLATLIKTSEFMELTQLAQQTITIITLTFTFLISIWSTIHMLLDYSGKSEKCKDISSGLFELIGDVKEVRAKSYAERPEFDEVMGKFGKKLAEYEKSMFLIPYNVIHKYYPEDVTQLRDLFAIEENNRPVGRNADIDLESAESL